MQPNNPLHGITLEMMLVAMHAKYGWLILGDKLGVRAFDDKPTVKSALKFFRKTPWAREKLEDLYLEHALALSAPHPSGEGAA